MHKYNIMLAMSEQGMNSTEDLRIILENFGAEVLHNLNAVKHVLTKCLPLDFMSMKFKEFLTEQLSEGLSLNTTVSICVSFC
jgi:hypothetical protein